MFDFRHSIDSEVLTSSNSNRLLLTAALPGGPYWGQNYLVNETINYVDWMNIMAYNVLGTWGGITDCSSPLQNPQNMNGDSIMKAVSYFLSQSAQSSMYNNQPQPSKFNLGMSLWGISYKLISSQLNGVGAPAHNGSNGILATPGWCTKQPGYLAYFEIKPIIQNTTVSIQVNQDPIGLCNYFVYNGDQLSIDTLKFHFIRCSYRKENDYLLSSHVFLTIFYAFSFSFLFIYFFIFILFYFFHFRWVGYDDSNSFSKKIEWMKTMNLGGISIWGIDADIPNTWELNHSINQNLIS